MANCVDPDEMARYEPSHLDQQFLRKHKYWSTKLIYNDHLIVSGEISISAENKSGINH